MKKFSERKGFKKVSEIIQKKGMKEELRNTLWNIIDIFIWDKLDFRDAYPQYDEIETFTFSLWHHFLKKPIDTIPILVRDKLKYIRGYFFKCEWYEVYDFIEFIDQQFKIERFKEAINEALEKDFSGWRLVDHIFVDITDDQEIEMLEETFKDDRFEGVSQHLKRALGLLADRDNPDYRNSIKESISAVESICQVITEKDSATLGDALKILERDHKLHPALKEGFSKLYGYTSDEDGIRHAMSEEPDIDSADAKYFLMSCTSFINYLKSKI